MGRWAARKASCSYLGISDLVGTVVGWAGAVDERKARSYVDLPGTLARGRHASSVAVGTRLCWTLETSDAFYAEKYWTEVGD